jgi:acetyl-CoA acetyltransferase/uncharacterized OB-fold protein
MIYVRGVGETAYSRRSGRSVPDLAAEASRAALADAGLDAVRVDGVIPLGGFVFTEDLMAGLGLPGQVFDASPAPGGNAAVSALRLAESVIGSGTASCVLIVLARNGSSGARIDARARLLPGQQFRTQLEHPHGWSLPAQWYAMICRRHMAEYGTSKDQLAAVALSAYRSAQANPRAMRYGRALTPRRYHEADMIADPYQRYDCCLETDGAAAIVVTAEPARSRPARPAARQAGAGEDRAVPVLAVETARPPSPDDLTNRPDWHHIGLTDAAPAAWERAGVAPADLDAAMIYDCFTFEVIHQLEEAGFCPRGEGGPFAASGALDPGGRLPVNPHGGLLAEGHLGGLNHVIEAVRQLRGEAAGRQLARARLIGVTGWGDWGDGSLAVLGRPPTPKASPPTAEVPPARSVPIPASRPAVPASGSAVLASGPAVPASGPAFPAPDLDDPDFAPFWAGCRDERLLLPRCGQGHRYWPPRPACPRCQDTARDWQEVAPAGWLYSWTVVHRTPLPAFQALTPYVVGVVELVAHPGLRLLGRCQCDPGLLRVGLPLHAEFEHVTEQFSLPLWRGQDSDGGPGSPPNPGSTR